MICNHGQLARQCELCDMDREIETLRSASLRLLDALDRLDHGHASPAFVAGRTDTANRAAMKWKMRGRLWPNW